MGNQEEAHMISDAGAGAGADDKDVNALSDGVRTLPPHAVKDLLATGVCVRCIFRLFGLRECIRCCASLSPSSLDAVFEKVTGSEVHMMEDLSGAHSSQESQVEQHFCRICLGILEFAYYDNKKLLMKRGCVTNFAVSIAEMVRQEDYQIHNFALEVSIPPIVMENEEATWLYMRRKYDSELWFQEKCLSERISAKDALIFSITNALENLLGVQCGLSSFHIRLTYNHSEASSEVLECNKRRKTGQTIALLYKSYLYWQEIPEEPVMFAPTTTLTTAPTMAPTTTSISAPTTVPDIDLATYPRRSTCYKLHEVLWGDEWLDKI